MPGSMVFGDEAHVTNIAVDPAAHRRKVASRLLFALVTEARRRGATACTPEVRVANHAAQGSTTSSASPRSGSARTTTPRPARTPSSCGPRAFQTPAYGERLAGLAAGIPEPREL